MLKRFVKRLLTTCNGYKLKTRHNQVLLALLVALSIVAAIFISPASYSQPPSKIAPPALSSLRQNPTGYELRGVWLTNIDSDVLFQRDRLSTALQRLHELNFNTVYPTVWNWGYTLYPSRVAKREIGRSPLQRQDCNGETSSKKLSSRDIKKAWVSSPGLNLALWHPLILH